METGRKPWTTLSPPISPWLLEALNAQGLDTMTPVQAACIPYFMGNKDVVVEAVTGSGKTFAFLIPLVERILRAENQSPRHHVAAIVLSPTTELAQQTHIILQRLISFHAPSAGANDSEEEARDGRADTIDEPRIAPQLLVAGKITPADDLRAFIANSPNILIATPGRLVELLASPRVICSSLEILILDEADRLLDIGFIPSMQKILARVPKQRRTGLFSATVSEALDQLIRVSLRNPIRISVKSRGLDGRIDKVTPASLEMRYIVQPASDQPSCIARIFRTLPIIPSRSIVFFSTCASVEYFRQLFPIIMKHAKLNVTIIPLHGKQHTKARHAHFRKFIDSTEPSMLLTTDLAARGLDIPQVDLVIQFDAPGDPKVFLHRCGRAGRAGRRGLSVLFLKPGPEEEYPAFLKNRQTPVEAISLKEEEDSSSSEGLLARLRATVLTDRALHDKAQRGFVSWVKAYRKHQASQIFRFEDLDWTSLAKAWALLKMPRMPELKNWEGDPSLGLGIDWDSYAYLNKAQEHSRQLQAAEPQRRPARPIEKRAWSKKIDQKAVKEAQRQRRATKREQTAWEHMSSAEREKRRQLDALIAKIRQQNQGGSRIDHDSAEFEGFDD